MSVLSTRSGRAVFGAAGFVALRLSLGTALAAGLLVGAPALAQAQGQVAAVEPYYVVTTGSDAVLRCGTLDTFYIVANLKPGQILRVDGESENWKRVGYPAGATVFVATDDVQVSADGKTATLIHPSNLKAANATHSGLKGSWKNVFDPTPLAAGAKLTVVKLEQTEDAKKQAYRVEAPAEARAFIHNGYVRKATDAEVTAAGLTPLAAPAPNQPKTDAGTPAGNQPAQANPTAPDAGVTPPQSAPLPNPRSNQPAGAETKTPLEAGPGERPLATPEQLSAAFEEVRKQPTVSAELDELIAEYQRTIDARTAAGADQRVTTALRQRQELLKLRKDLQAQMIALEEAKKAAGEAGRDAAVQVAEVNKTRHYEVIGRLTTSTVYDGKTLPLMYRVQSVGDTVARTLGYLKPNENLELEKKIGQIVGISGDASMDSALKLNVLTATRVDILEAAPAQEAAATDKP